MKIAISVCCYFLVLTLSMVEGQRQDRCDRAITSGSADFTRSSMNRRSSSALANLGTGNRRPSKCMFLSEVLDRMGLSGECGPAIRDICPATRRVTRPAPRRQAFDTAAAVAPFDAASIPSPGIPSDCPQETILCDVTAEYRTIDGSCNNLANPRWGRSGTPQIRLLPDAYDDGLGSSKTRSCDGGTLPSARKVSNLIHSAGKRIKFEPYLSLLVMQIGQLFIHDSVVTHQFTGDDGSALECCSIEDRNNPNCDPITIPQDDTFFTPNSCMNFARSKAVRNCSSIRQQVNDQTAPIDLSIVYGATDEEATKLRTFTGGQLKHVKRKLPLDPTDSTCFLSRPFDPENYYCPVAGDARVIEQPGLASAHTLFMREHNRLATGLAILNPHWNDEKLYQEARRINIAMWQNIVYSEFLPSILGNDVLSYYDLRVPKVGYNEKYDARVDLSISNPFAAAVFRFGHTLVHDVIGRINSNHAQVGTPRPLEREFFEPAMYHAVNGSGLEDILRWTTSTACPFADRNVEDLNVLYGYIFSKVQDSVRQKLFIDAEGKSLDLVSLNIHRGRDHGLPGYTEYRKWCRLSTVTHFGTGRGGLRDHTPRMARKLQNLYACPKDIDLFTGLLTERRRRGSLFGKTWACLLASEFKRLRNGDRFFFDRLSPQNPKIAFSPAQLSSIKRVTMSDIICRNTDTRYIQPNAFRQPEYRQRGYTYRRRGRVPNELTYCSQFRGVNINLWREFRAF